VGHVDEKLKLVEWASWALLLLGANDFDVGPERAGHARFSVCVVVCWLAVITRPTDAGPEG